MTHAHPIRRRAMAAASRMRRFARSRGGRALGAAALTLIALTLLRASDPWIITELKERTFDGYQRLKPRQPADAPVWIVDIDEASIAQFGQWPWPRTRLAALSRRLGEMGAAVVAYDILFPEPDRTTPSRLANELARTDFPERDAAIALLGKLPDHDADFAAALAATSGVLGFAASAQAGDARPPVKPGLAFVGVDPARVLPAFRGALSNLPALNEAAAGIGAINLSARDRAGIVRRVPVLMSDGARVYPSLAIEALRIAQNQKGIIVRGTGASGDSDTGQAALVDMRVGAFRVPLTHDGEAWIYFERERGDRTVSARDILDPAKQDALRPLMEGAIVLVGTSASGLLDARVTPLGQTAPGVAIHAQLIEQIIAQDFIERPDWADGLEIVVTLMLGSLVAGLLLLFGVRFSLIAGALTIATAIAASWLAFSHLRLLIDPLFPSLAALATYIAVERVLHTAADREKKFVRRAFGQYLAPELLARLEAAPDGLRLGGESREITVMFMDVRGFTPISENLSATELVDFINTLLAPLSDAIQEELGTIDKYIGDSIMAFWNAPVDVSDHATRACRAALKMRAAVAQLNAQDAFGFRARGLSTVSDVHIGVGLNTGQACVGNMGSQRRFNYSAMGDVVNIAARIESTTKSFGTDLLVSEDVAATAQTIALLEAGEIMLKGKSSPTRLFAIAGDEAYAASADFAALRQAHDALLAAFANGSADLAVERIAACRALAPSELSGLYDHFAESAAALAPRPQAAQ